jgi:hypothetical protein
MKMKFGAIVTEGRGKIGGHVASKNRAGAYLRTKVTPVNPQSIAQMGVRSLFSSLSSAWKGLTADQRNSWLGAVSDYAKTDIFGDLKNPTGAQLYQRLNNNLVNIGETALLVAPAPVAIPNLESLTVAIAAGAGTMIVNFSPVIPVTEKFIVKATPAVSAGVSFVKSEYRQIAVKDSTFVTTGDLAADWENKFGDIGAAGQKIFIQFIPVVIATGQAGTPISCSAIISA